MKNKIIFTTIGTIIYTVIAIPVFISAQSSTSGNQQNTVSNLTDQINDLPQQVNATSTQDTKLDAKVESKYFVSSLDIGSQGDEVKVLQTLLHMMVDIYPDGSISGYYGKLTKEAVMRLQKLNELEETGKIDEKTRVVLNRHLKTHPVTLETNPGPDYVKPQINSVIFTNDSKTSATVNVVSNKNTTSTMWYGTSTPININKLNNIKSDIPGLLHSFTVQSLAPGLTYYYLVKVSDSFGTASSTEYSFIMK